MLLPCIPPPVPGKVGGASPRPRRVTIVHVSGRSARPVTTRSLAVRRRRSFPLAVASVVVILVVDWVRSPEGADMPSHTVPPSVEVLDVVARAARGQRSVGPWSVSE